MKTKRLFSAKSNMLIVGLLVLLPLSMYGGRYHDLKFTIDSDSVEIVYPKSIEENPRNYVGVQLESINGESGRYSDFYFLIRTHGARITNESKNISIKFTLEIPHEDLMGGGAGASAQGIVAEPGHFESADEFDFHSVSWPQMGASNWTINPNFGKQNQAQVTISLTLGESVSGAEKNSIEYELSGAGSIQTLDWSSHQRAQAKKKNRNVWELFPNNPDGRGRVQEADNPQAIGLHFAQFITKFPQAQLYGNDKNLSHTTIEGTEAEFEVQVIPEDFFENTEHFSEFYNWSITHPTGSVGHDPIENKDLNNRNQRIMNVSRAKWFAEPNSPWLNKAGTACEYRINIEVGPVQFPNTRWTVII